MEGHLGRGRGAGSRRLGLALLVVLTGGVASAADVLTSHNNNARTGVNSQEALLKTANVNPDNFGRLWTLYADGQIVAQPLYVSRLAIDTSGNPGTPLVKGTFNAIVVGTMHNTVYVYDADKENRLPDGKTKPLWATWLGQPRPGGKDIDMWSTNDPEWGILSTPVIDAQKTTLWVVAWHNDNGTFRYRLHALDLKSGAARRPAIVIGGAPPDPAKPCNYAGGYNPCKQKQRPGLLLQDGVIYAAFGGDGSRGCVFGFDAGSLQQRAFWSSTPTGGNGGIWQSGQAPAADDDGNIFLMTGNGTFDAIRGGRNYGDSFVRLRLEGQTLAVKDYFTPCNEKFLNDIDLDLGSSGPVLVPGTKLVYGGGKQGVIYLLSQTNLGKHVATSTASNCVNANAVQQFMGAEPHVEEGHTHYGNIHGSPVFWKGPDTSRLYVWGENNPLRAFPFKNGKFVTAQQQTSIYRPPDGMPGGMLAVSSNGAKAGTGIVWAAVPLDGDANKQRGVRGILLALDAQNVSRQLWTSELAGPRDRLGLFANFVPPTVANGKVFMATYGDKDTLRIYGGNERPNQFPKYGLAVYGLLPRGGQQKPVVNQDSDDLTVTKAVATAPVGLNASACAPLGGGSLDCTAALAQKFGAPSLHRLVVPAGFNFNGCNVLRVTTASKQGAVADASRIGWYAAEATAGVLAEDTGRAVMVGELKQVGTGKLKNGTPAVLHEFVGVANCPAGQGSIDRVFKPYMQFDNAADGKIYRNWDKSANYRVSRAAPQFDRSGEVLSP